MATISVHKLAYALVAMFTVSVVIANAAPPPVNCGTVQESLTPCIGYLKTSGPAQPTPPANCCAGVRSVKVMAETTGEHKAVCQCLKQVVTNIQGLNYDLAARLPAQCGVSMSYTISPNTDCSKVTG